MLAFQLKKTQMDVSFDKKIPTKKNKKTMKNYKYFGIYVILVTLLFLGCKDCNVIPNAQSPNPMVKSMLDLLQTRGYPINNLEYDQNGFPFKKGEYVVKFKIENLTNGIKGFKEGDTLVMKNHMLTKLRGVKGFGKCFDESDVVFKFCECGSYALMTIKSNIVGSPTPQDVKSTSVGDDTIDINPNYINYHSEANPFINLPAEIPNPTQSTSRTNQPIDVAILDTGIRGYINVRQNVSDRNLKNCVGNNEGIYGINFMSEVGNNIYNVSVLDSNGHGTAVAGVINKIYGKTDLITVGIQDKKGAGELYAAVCGIKYAVRKGAKIVNGSWNFVMDNSTKLSILESAIKEAGQQNVIFVAAAGNDGKELGNGINIYPAMFYDNDVSDNDNVIVVAAMDTSGTVASYSNYGRRYVDVLAYGDVPNYYYFQVTGNETYSSGTSFATPIITGSLVKIFSTQPSTIINKNALFSSSLVEINSNFNEKINNGKVYIGPRLTF